MPSNLKPNINQKFVSYLSNCDLINKYNFKNSNHIPRVKKVSLELNLKDFLSSSDISEKNQKHVLSQTKAYLLLYLALGFIPQINYNKNIMLKQKVLRGSEPNYSLKLTFSTQKELNSIFNSIFIDNFAKFQLDGFDFFYKTKVNKKVKNLKYFLFNTSLPGNFLSEVETFFKEGVNFKNFKFKFKVLLSNPIAENNKNIIKNLPFFWISG